MNIRSSFNSPSRSRRHEQGVAVIVVIAILAILFIYVGGNIRTFHLLSRDLKQIEQKQLRRLSLAYPATNAAVLIPISWPTNQNPLAKNVP